MLILLFLRRVGCSIGSCRVNKILINFRREDVPNEARSLRDGLAAHLGRTEVMLGGDGPAASPRLEQDAPRPPVDFDVLLAVIGPRWLETMRAHEAAGRRDPERDQIAAALRRGRTVVPVLVGGEGGRLPMLRAAELPEDIRRLSVLPSRELAHDRFALDLKRLADGLRWRPDPIIAAASSHVAAGDRYPGNSGFKLLMWSLGIVACTFLISSLLFYLLGGSRMPAAAPSAGQPRPTAAAILSAAEERIRRAIAAAEAKGRQVLEARRCQTSLISATEAGTILFHTASAELDNRSHETLDGLARLIRSCPDFVIEVEGHTDSQGDATANLRLSERRANAVRDYLVKTGVPESAMVAIGFGDTRPLVPNDSPANMARNRRIEFGVTSR